MIVDGGCDGMAFALRFGVEAADNALQFGELLHHVCSEVGFGEKSGAIHSFGIGLEVCCDLLGEGTDAVGLACGRNQFWLER